MKVYELMKKLAGAPAGATVEVSKVMTLREVAEKECDAERAIDDKTVYDVGGEVKDIFHEHGETVLLYLE
ncbi:MAG: hypothetical protein IJX50_00220 [Clostridia bacterium]|nr:hypothetical protein [Clostridia bacterium]